LCSMLHRLPNLLDLQKRRKNLARASRKSIHARSDPAARCLIASKQAREPTTLSQGGVGIHTARCYRAVGSAGRSVGLFPCHGWSAVALFRIPRAQPQLNFIPNEKSNIAIITIIVRICAFSCVQVETIWVSAV
jgi:hypothetical protein